MATKLRTFNFSGPSNLTEAAKAVYPWDQWFDGDIWQLQEGVDFHTHPLMMERIIRTRAAGRKAKVQIRHVPSNGSAPFGRIVLKRTDIDGPDQERRRLAAQKRQEKRAKARADAKDTLAKAGITPSAGITRRKFRKVPAAV